MYSQNDEETVILDLFKGPHAGRVLDIGAYDGKTFSNTLALIERGWGGTLVEASSGPFHALAELHKGKPQLNLVNVLVGTGVKANEIVRFYSSDDAVASDDEDHYQKWKGHTGFIPVAMARTDINAVVELFPGPYEFVNIDIEGPATQAVFEALDYTALGTKVICVEHGGHKEKDGMRAIGERLGLTLHHTTKENHIWRTP